MYIYLFVNCEDNVKLRLNYTLCLHMYVIYIYYKIENNNLIDQFAT